MADVREANVELAVKTKPQRLQARMFFFSIQLNFHTMRIRGERPGIAHIAETRFEATIPKDGIDRIFEVGQPRESYALFPHAAGLGDNALLAKRIHEGIHVVESQARGRLKLDQVIPYL